MNLFTVDRDGDIVFDIEQYKAIPQILKIIKRDHGTKLKDGEVVKERSTQELRYIWYIYDFNSPGNRNAFKGAELEKEAKAFAGLAATWKPDEVVLDCIKECKKYYGGGAVRYARKLLESLENGKRIVTALTDRINSNLDELDSVGTSSKEEKSERRQIIKDMIEDLKQVTSLAELLPKQISTVDKAVVDALKEIGESKNDVWGGRELGNRED